MDKDVLASSFLEADLRTSVRRVHSELVSSYEYVCMYFVILHLLVIEDMTICAKTRRSR